MSDYYDFNDIYKNKYKMTKIFPYGYFKTIMKKVFQMFIPQNLFFDLKSGPISLYNRFFGFTVENHIFNVLVLVADLETNVGAACVELLNNEVPELVKHFNYHYNFPYFDDYLYIDDFVDETYQINNENIFNSSNIEEICDIQDEEIILDENCVYDYEQGNDINADFPRHVNPTSSESTVVLYNAKRNLTNINNEDSSDSYNTLDIKQENRNSFDMSSFTEASTSSASLEWQINENRSSDSESEDNLSDDLSISNRKLLPKPVKREINQLRILGVPYTYQNITQSSHEEFKQLRCNPNLTKSQLASMVSARRRYINRRAATRCRTQKLHQKDQLKVELKKVQEELARTKISLTKAYQKRNEIKDSFREMEQRFIRRLEVNGCGYGDDKVEASRGGLSPSKWSVEVSDQWSVLVREKRRLS